jgi:demethylmenaquinone methyltransferase/2-methoxy-6-polyprenyl-1,4-benzoquinol methylase
MTLELMNRFQEPEVRTAITALQLPAGSQGLDVGCGVGLYAQWLADAIGPDGHVLAIDHNPERVHDTVQRLQGRSVADRITVQEGQGTALPLPDQHVDWVWCADVLHHIDAAVSALKEFQRVLRPGGCIVIKESQVSPSVFLPGHLALERQLQRAEILFQQAEAGTRSFQERRQRTRETMCEAGLSHVTVRTAVVQRQAPLAPVAQQYIQQVIFDRNWGPRLRPFLSASDWEQRMALCDAHSPASILARPDYYCIYSFTLFVAQAVGSC